MLGHLQHKSFCLFICEECMTAVTSLTGWLLHQMLQGTHSRAAHTVQMGTAWNIQAKIYFCSKEQTQEWVNTLGNSGIVSLCQCIFWIVVPCGPWHFQVSGWNIEKEGENIMQTAEEFLHEWQRRGEKAVKMLGNHMISWKFCVKAIGLLIWSCTWTVHIKPI